MGEVATDDGIDRRIGRMLLLMTAVLTLAVGPEDYPPISSYDHNKFITQSYDKFHDGTKLELSLGPVFSDPDNSLRLDVFRIGPGEKRSRGDVTFYFYYNRGADGWRYLKYHEVAFLVDGQRWLYDPDHDGDVKTGYVLEHLFVRLSEDRFLKLANARSAEIKVGVDQIRLSYRDLQSIREFASLIGSPDAPIPDRTPAPPPRPATKARKKRPDFSQVDNAMNQMANQVIAQERLRQALMVRRSQESGPIGLTDNSRITGYTFLGACGAAKVDGGTCRNPVRGGGYCSIHR